MRESKGAGDMIQNLLPYDISISIASSLPVCDVCSLGSCSRFWREICESDVVWKSLYKDRWPKSFCAYKASSLKVSGWKDIYMTRHNETTCKALSLVKLIEHCIPSESIEAAEYLSAIRILSSMKFEFKDLEMFFLKPTVNVLLNLIGLHFCITWLQVPSDCLIEALESNKISDREVCARWWKLGRWFYGFRLRDESCSRQFSLRDLVTSKENEVLGVLQRGAIHEVLRVHISVAKPVSTPWSCQSLPSSS